MTLDIRAKAVIGGIDPATSEELDDKITFETIDDEVYIELPDWVDSGDDVRPWIRVLLTDLLAAARALEGRDDG